MELPFRPKLRPLMLVVLAISPDIPPVRVGPNPGQLKRAKSVDGSAARQKVRTSQ